MVNSCHDMTKLYDLFRLLLNFFRYSQLDIQLDSITTGKCEKSKKSQKGFNGYNENDRRI